MNPETLSWLLFGAALALLLRNIRDYAVNARYVNADLMGTMFNWHLGFAVAWLPLCIGLMLHPRLDWLVGATGIPLVLLATWVFWFPVHHLLKALGLIERQPKTVGSRKLPR
jgi:hypothetical protein